MMLLSHRFPSGMTIYKLHCLPEIWAAAAATTTAGPPALPPPTTTTTTLEATMPINSKTNIRRPRPATKC